MIGLEARRIQFLIMFIVILFMFVLQPHVIYAHSPIEDRFPKNGEIFEASPSTVEVWFKDPIEIYSDSIVVRNDEGKKIKTNKTIIDKDDPRHIVLTFQSELNPSTYAVEVNVIGQDGHIINDEFAFTVKEPELTEAEIFERLQLVKAAPSDAEVIDISPQYIELWFSEAADLTVFALLDDHQQTVLFKSKKSFQDQDRGDYYKIELDKELSKGTYSIFWNASIGDKTKMGETYFAVEEVTSISGIATLRTESFWERLNLQQLANWISFMSLLTLLGGTFFNWKIAKKVGNRSRWKRAMKYLVLAGTIGFVLKLLGLKLGYSQVPFNEWLTLTAVWITWLQLIILGISPFLRSTQSKLLIFSFIVLGWAFEGHSAAASYGGSFGILIDALHLFAIAVWLGGLVALVVLMPEDQKGSWFKEQGKSYSKWALASILITGITGVWMWLQFVPSFSWSSLISSHWGTLLFIKILLFTGIVILGYFQRKSLKGWLDSNTDGFLIRFKAEMVIAVCILLAAALLIDMSPKEATQGVFPGEVMQGNVEASVQITPLQLGANDFIIEFNNQPKLKEVYVVFYMTPEWRVENKAFEMGEDHYFLTGNFFHAPGELKLEVKAITETEEEIIFPYTIQIPGRMDTQ
jgi:copper transport protein